MDETAQLLTLIGDIYDAALDPSLWPLALGRAKGFVGGVAASLYSKDAVNKCGNMFYQNADGIDPGQQLLGYAVDQDKGDFASGKLRISRFRGR